MSWILFGLLAGITLGFYDYWTKKAMTGNGVFPVVFWSSMFGAFAWLPFFTPFTSSSSFHVDIGITSWHSQALILVKGLMMTASWLFAYFSVRELPLSFSGAVRASGPIWTFIGGAIVFGDYLTPIQLTAVLASVFAYYLLSQIGKSEGISALKSLPMAMMLVATVLSAMTTVYDKYIVQTVGLASAEIQAWSAIHRFLIAGLLLALFCFKTRTYQRLVWSIWIPLTGLSWVVAEWIYFLAIADPAANVTYLSIFRRTSLVVGFLLSVTLIGERNVMRKSIVIALIVASTATLVLQG
ncbi:DMT family transporter [Roseibium sp. RKSG952]|uniref:DMT family transporter n=1 Tax=Roseibium sp. RKSG952 TaxID=2529384 RepID=UPI0012BCA7F7|nr:DMT family transporter [Roseibium sp. RKSG952]MTH95629.1 DMT family transporter [Roseibium sp. RKSG952]